MVVFRTSELPRLADTTVSNSSPSEAADVSLPGCLICFTSTWTCRSGSRVVALAREAEFCTDRVLLASFSAVLDLLCQELESLSLQDMPG